MAELKFSLGATADIASGHEISEAARDIRNHIDSRLSLNKDHRAAMRLVIAGTQAVNQTIGGISNATIVMPLGQSPATGRYWTIRSLSVYDPVTPLTAEAFNFWLAIGNPQNPGTSDLQGVVGTGLPYGATFNANTLVVMSGQAPYLVCASTVATTVVATLRIEEYLIDSYYETRL